MRIPTWIARMRSLGDAGAFYARSFVLDELGTAARIVEWRDALVEGGWNGERLIDGGPRLDALAALESHIAEPFHPLVAVERALRSGTSGDSSARLYDSLTLLEPRTLWPGRWRTVFELLAEGGTTIVEDVYRTAFAEPNADAATDLGRLQRSLIDGAHASEARGDGSILVLRGDTLADLGEITALLLARAPEASVVVRCCQGEALDIALRAHGLPAQGKNSESRWRPALQVLALALELAFEPRDPYRALELLTLPLGPFRGLLGTRLARAVAQQPGIGGKEWRRQKSEAAQYLEGEYARRETEAGHAADADVRARERVAERMRDVADWLETAGTTTGTISRARLLAVVDRARLWHQSRVRAGEGDAFVVAYTQTARFAATVAADSRTSFTREEVRQLFDRFGRIEQQHELSIEDAGRAAHVNHPGSLLGSSEQIILWAFVGGVERKPSRLPWSAAERAALSAAGVRLVESGELLEAEAQCWRRAVLAARKRLVLVVPRSIRGTPTTTHSLWDEIRARLSVDDEAASRLTREATELRNRPVPWAPSMPIAPLALPPGQLVWELPPEVLTGTASATTMSVTALERIASCPFAWVLEQRGGFRSGAVTKVARGSLLHGALAHRLVEELHASGAFDRDETHFLSTAADRFERLLAEEGASLLMPGFAIERLQLSRQILAAMRALHRYLVESGYRIVAVEEEIATTSTIGPLHGRLDLRLGDADGRTAILDLKWGASSYRAALEKGSAVQLAVYARALTTAGGVPAAGYFSCASGVVLTTDPRMRSPRMIVGPSLQDTWRRVEATARAVLDAQRSGVVHVPAAKKKLPLLEALGIPDIDRDRYLDVAPDAACGYCRYDAICGRQWSAFV